MARYTFGGDVASYIWTKDTGGVMHAAPASILTFWSAATAGTQYTDLLLAAAPVTTITADSTGYVPLFSGPDGIATMYVSADGGARKRMDSPVSGTAFTQLPATADKVVYVSNRGNDSNDGASSKSALLTVQAAITALGGPGVIQLGQGAISTATGLSLGQSAGVTIRGMGGTTSGATPGSTLTYTGTGSGSFIDARSSTGFTLENVMVLYSSSSFTGRLIDLRDDGTHGNTTFTTIRDCYLGGASAIRTATSLVDISTTHSLRFERTQFRGAVYGIRGKNSTSDTCNAINIHDCYFNDQTTAHILNPGDGWTITGCTWEALHSGIAGAVICESGFACNGVAVLGGWAGDILAAAGGTQFDFTGHNISIIGTLIGGNTTSTGVKFRNLTGPVAPAGLTVAARFDGCPTGIDMTGVAPESYDFSRSSFASNVTTPITGGVFMRANIDTRDDQAAAGLRQRSTASGRVAYRFQSDMTSTYTYDLGMDLDGGNVKRFGLRDQTRSGTPHAWYVTALGSVVLGKGTAALATTATDGFTYIPTCAGTPTGTATSETGMAPMIVDTTGSKLWVRVGGTWKSTTLA